MQPLTADVLLTADWARELLETQLFELLRSKRWFSGKSNTASEVHVIDSVPVVTGAHALELALVAVASDAGEPTSYVLPLAIDSPSGDVSECSGQPAFWRELFRRLVSKPAGILSRSGLSLVLKPGPGFGRLQSLNEDSPIEIHSGEQSNTSIILGTDVFLKLFRKVEPGINPDAEVASFLSSQTSFTATPQLVGTIELVDVESSRCLALLTERIDSVGDAWTTTLHELSRYWNRVADGDQRESPELLGTFLSDVERLGRRTAELHAALASSVSDPAFTPEPFTQTHLDQLIATVSRELSNTCRLLEEAELTSIDPAALLEAGQNELARLSKLKLTAVEIQPVRCHGDYHLGQVLWTGSDWMIIDFEGEPDRPLSERREKRCVLKDVAGMIRSFHYASNAASVGLIDAPSDSIRDPRRWQDFWYQSCLVSFLQGYFVDGQAQVSVPEDEFVRQQLLELFLLEKVLYELRYEIQNRPDWIPIPLLGLADVLRLPGRE